MTKDLDERQRALHHIDTLRSKPMWIEPSKHKRRTWLQRVVIRLKAIVFRPHYRK